MRIVIVGGSGFIGTRFIRRLSASGHELCIVDKAPSRDYPHLVSFADVRDLESLKSAVGRADVLVNLAAEHRDDVRPKELYDTVNVGGAFNVCEVCRMAGIRRVIFTSSVAVYGFASRETGEEGVINPFNDYGRTKAEAESVYRDWAAEHKDRSLTIVRPTVVFGERNRGNVYNLIRQIAKGPFLMVGRGTNVKSVAYVENLAAYLEASLSGKAGVKIVNYVDKPDYDMNGLVARIDGILGRKRRRGPRLPYIIALAAGFSLDLLSRLTQKTFSVSAIKVKKFTSDSLFSTRVFDEGFVPPVSLDQAWERTVRYEFIEDHEIEHLFFSE